MAPHDYPKGSIPKRLIVAIMIFIACATSFMLRVQMSINIIAMVQASTKSDITTPMPANQAITQETVSTASESFTNETLPVTTLGPPLTVFGNDPEASKKKLRYYGPRYNWDQRMQGQILGAYYYGYLFTSLPAGMMADRFGAKVLLTISFVLSSITIALTPVFASLGAWYVIGSRVFVGVLAGFVYPALHKLISRWIPPNERGKVIACLSGGGTFGTVVTWPISGLIIDRLGWDYAFYLPALFVLAIAVIWISLIENSPAKHKTISDEERLYIEDSLGATISKAKSWPPFRQVFTSLPYLSLLLLHYGNFWGMNLFSTQTPKFINEVLGFKLSNAGILSSLPYLARMFSGFFFGIIGDRIRQKELMSTTAIRKTFCFVSHILPGTFLIVLPFVAKDPLVCVGCMIACLGFNGAATITNLVNAQDLAPNFAATLYGFMNFIGTTAGFLAPMMVAFYTEESNTIEQWKNVFLISAGIYILCGCVFVVFGSGKVQKWNDVQAPTTSSNGVENNNEKKL
ncbi:sialin-like [Uranotaenia lowii]|uniref:sialin-like n=1 Tax=Uranotaenia lowii TaxID=190385 RepID=UPI00247A8E81|nr:sialin-like [Uranotaenia lowii]